MKAIIFSYTRHGAQLSVTIKTFLQSLGYETKALTLKKFMDIDSSLEESQSCLADTKTAFAERDVIIYIGSCGIAVRNIAPFLINKTVDPAVISIDEKGKFAISLLSGHIGGANDLTRKIAKEINAEPIITTATDINGLFAVDEWATKNDCYISSMKVAKKFAAALVDKKTVGFRTNFNVEGELPTGLKTEDNCAIGLCIADNLEEAPFPSTLTLVPRIYTLGVGCKKDTPLEKIENLIFKELKELKIDIHAIKEIVSVDLKKDEKGLLAFAEKYEIPTRFFSAEELKTLPGTFSGSKLVEKVVGVDNVCERAAVYASKAPLVLKKTSLDGVTMALTKKEFFIDFQK